jgi:cell division transport system ATP-binding protein
MIKFERVTKIYRTKNKKEILALNDISFEIKEGELVLIVGSSGAGKTTIFKLILAHERPTKGKIFFGKKEISKIKGKEISDLRRKIGMVFQDYKLLAQKNVYENLSFIMEVTNFSEREIKKDIPKVLGLVGLEDKIENFPDELSAGEKQRLAIARALIHRPKVILADEPTGNLDLCNSLEILKILKKINEMGRSIIIATHSNEVVSYLRKRVIYIEDGKIVGEKRAEV